MKYIVVILCLIILAGCTTISKGDFSYMSTKDVNVSLEKKPNGEVSIKVETKSTGKKELMQGFIEAFK